MLKLIQTEFMKLRRRKIIWLMLLAALFMPIMSVIYFRAMGNVIDTMTFYKWSALGYTLWIILPAVLGMLCTLILHDENRYDILKQLWIVPVHSLKLFISKFVVVLFYSTCFMLITAAVSVICALAAPSVAFSWDNTLFLFVKCLEIGVLTTFSMLPILAIASAQKGYILPMCATLIYNFLGFIMLMMNMYLHPLSSMSAIIANDIPSVILNQPLNISAALICIFLWGAVSTISANIALRARK